MPDKMSDTMPRKHERQTHYIARLRDMVDCLKAENDELRNDYNIAEKAGIAALSMREARIVDLEAEVERLTETGKAVRR